MTDLNENKSAKESISLDKCSSPGHEEAPISNTLAEASEYVASIMSSQMISKVDTPNANSRKRNLSVSGLQTLRPKKHVLIKTMISSWSWRTLPTQTIHNAKPDEV